MADPEIFEATAVIGEITLQLKHLGIVPKVELTNVVKDGEIIFTVAITYHDGFSRKPYCVKGEASHSPELAYKYALEGFWLTLLQETRRKDKADAAQ